MQDGNKCEKILMLRDWGFVCFYALAVSKSRLDCLPTQKLCPQTAGIKQSLCGMRERRLYSASMARADCLKAMLSAYNSDTGKTQEIGFEDLQVGDYVVIGLYDNEKAQAQTETVHAESVERMRQNLRRIEKHLQSAT